MKRLITSCSCVVVAFAAISAPAADVVTVPQWQPQDFEFATRTSATNPFVLSFHAQVTRPDGTTFSLPGFFDGNNTWKVRVCPTVEGKWSLLTQSELPELSGKRAVFECAPNTNRNIHGILRVDREHPHHFIFDDGSRYFMQGYEYDWLWALDMDKPGVPTVEKSLDLIAGCGFNQILLDTYAYDTKWRPRKSGPDDYGPPLLIPWEGENGHPVWSRMNLTYWAHFDRVMAALCERGMQAHLLIKVYNKGVNWPVQNSLEEKLFFRWLIARYAAYPNVIWDFSKEAQRETNVFYKQGWLKYLRQKDPYHHLVTVHDDDSAYESGDYDGLVDFRADQQHSHYHGTILRQRARRPWPVANVESDYECGSGGITDKTYNSAQSTDKTLRTLWEIAMAGGYTVYYYTYTAWDVIHPLDEPPGYAGMRHFGDFWRRTDYWLLQPSDELVNHGWCLANKGREYVVYLNDAKPFTLQIKGAKKSLSSEWFNPFTGETEDAGVRNDGTVKFIPPANWGGAPLVLHLRTK